MTERQALEVLSGRYYMRAQQAREQGDLREALRLISGSIYAAERAAAFAGSP